MTDLTREEKRILLEKAKAGDPEANYRISFWALERAEDEPDNPTWNKLAVDCLMTAAEGGCGQAERYLAQLRLALEVQAPAAKEYEPDPAEDDLFREESAAEWTPAPTEKHAKQEPVHRRAKAAGGVAGLAVLGESIAEKGKNLAQKAAGFVAGLKNGAASKGGAEWTEAKWKRVQLMCVIACIVLAFLIVLMLVTGKSGKAEAEEVAMPTPAAAEHVTVTPSPSPVPYPDEATKAVIAAAELDIFPEDGDYVSEATTAKLKVNSGLNLRSGPSSSYGQIVLMEANAQVEVYAVKNGWALVLYEDDTWGWCSKEYLSID